MIPVYKPYLNSENLKYAHKALESGWVSSQGEYLDYSKNKIKEIFGYKRVILTNNGTAATHLLAIALKFKYPKINKIIVPNNVYVAAWNSFLFDKTYKLIPVDSDLDTWNFNIDKLEPLLDEYTAVLVVHNIGNIVNVSSLRRKFPSTIFLEDNCEGFLGKYENKYSGTESFASSISFFGNKTITSGEGGAFVTSDDETFEFINKVKSQGHSDHKYIHDVLGYNYRMTNIQAAILYGQLEFLSEIKEKKHNIFQQYKTTLSNISNLSFQKIEDQTEHSNWMFGLRFNNFTPEDKKKLELHLFKKNIDTRPMFYDITKHKYLSHLKSEITNSKMLNDQCLILPSFPELTKSQIEFICGEILKFVKNENKII